MSSHMDTVRKRVELALQGDLEILTLSLPWFGLLLRRPEEIARLAALHDRCRELGSDVPACVMDGASDTFASLASADGEEVAIAIAQAQGLVSLIDALGQPAGLAHVRGLLAEACEHAGLDADGVAYLERFREESELDPAADDVLPVVAHPLTAAEVAVAPPRHQVIDLPRRSHLVQLPLEELERRRERESELLAAYAGTLPAEFCDLWSSDWATVQHAAGPLRIRRSISGDPPIIQVEIDTEIMVSGVRIGERFFKRDPVRPGVWFLRLQQPMIADLAAAMHAVRQAFRIVCADGSTITAL